MNDQEAVARFDREYLQYHGISAQRARQQKDLLLDFGSTLPKGLVGAQGHDVQAVAGVWMDQGFHVNTVRKKLNMIRPFFSWAYAVRLITPEQFMDIKLVKDPRGSSAKSIPNPYNRSELIRFWHELDERLPILPQKGTGSQAIKRFKLGTGHWRHVWRHSMRLQVECAVRLALDMGLRRNEIYQLDVDQLHYENEYLAVLGKRDPNTGRVKWREVPYTSASREANRKWLEFRLNVLKPKHQSPWCTSFGSTAYANPMHHKRFEGLLSAVVGPGWRWHRMRHTCATLWLRSGADLQDVQRLLGHANLQQTLAYAEILKSDVAKRLGQVEGQFEQLAGAESPPVVLT